MSMNRDASLFAEAEKLLEDLVAFPSLSRQENTGIIEYVENYLNRYGAHTVRVPISENRWNLFATIGPQKDGGLCLSGHLDVVPADEEGWNYPPYALTRENGRYYGRGTTDMKGFLALVLAMVPVWADDAAGNGESKNGESMDAASGGSSSHNPAPRSGKPIHLAFTYDEENGCSGAPALIRELGVSLPKPEAVIVGEPTGMVPVLGHRGGTACFTEVRGLSSHSSNPEAGINAIYTASDLIRYLREVFGRYASRPQGQCVFSPAYSTISVGTISGGTARNVIPDYCGFEWEIRSLPGEDPNDTLRELEDYGRSLLLPLMNVQEAGLQSDAPAESVSEAPSGAASAITPSRTAVLSAGEAIRVSPSERASGLSSDELPPGLPANRAVRLSAGESARSRSCPSITTTVRSSYPALEPDLQSRALERVRKAGCTSKPAVVNFGTEAGLYQQAGIPAVVWGPGNIEQAHTNDEFIMKNQLTAFLAYLRNL